MSSRLDPEGKVVLQQLAAADDRTLSAFVNGVLRYRADTLHKRPNVKYGDK
jgi:hypothetical protein